MNTTMIVLNKIQQLYFILAFPKRIESVKFPGRLLLLLASNLMRSVLAATSSLELEFFFIMSVLIFVK